MKKTCIRCYKEKPVEEFRKAPTIFGGDGRSKKCNACLKIERDERRAARAATPAEEPEDPNTPKLSIPNSMAVDVKWTGGDLVIEQDNDDAHHTVFLSPLALQRIVDFYQKLPPPAQPISTLLHVERQQA